MGGAVCLKGGPIIMNLDCSSVPAPVVGTNVPVAHGMPPQPFLRHASAPLLGVSSLQFPLATPSRSLSPRPARPLSPVPNVCYRSGAYRLSQVGVMPGATRRAF